MRIKGPHIMLGGLLLTLLVSSCSTVKHLPEEEVLYLGTRSLRYYSAPPESGQTKVRKKADKSIPVIQTLWVKPNGALLGMPFIRFIPLRLYFHNWFYTERDSTFSSWMMENFGEPPRTISDVNPEARVRLIENHLLNQGYFGVTGAYDLKYKNNGKENKAWIRYYFVMPDAYAYRRVQVKLDSSQQRLHPSVDKYMSRSLLQPGDQLTLIKSPVRSNCSGNTCRMKGIFTFARTTY